MKKTLFICLMGILVLGLVFSAGCFQADHNKATINGTKTYNVAVSGTFPPFGMVGKGGAPEGFEIDLMNAIAEAEGVQFNYQVTSWASKMPALKTKLVDVVICSMTITEERKKEVDFSDPYFESTNYMLVSEGSPIQSIDDLKGKTVAVLQASTSDFAVSELLGKDYEGIRRFKHTTTAFLELRNHNVDASVGDSGIVMYYAKSNPEAKLMIIEDTKFPKEYYGIAVRKGDTALLQILNNGLKKVKGSGKYEQIYQRWFNQ